MSDSVWLFVRHGESVANAEGWLSGHVDVELSQRGRLQAAGVAEELRGRGIVRCFSSDLVRAVETARISLGGRDVPWVKTAALRERHMGVLEGQMKALHKGTAAWEAMLEWDGGPEGGESLRDAAVRMLPFLAGVGAVEGATLVVGHGSSLKTLVGLLDGEALEEIGRTVLGNCEVVQRRVRVGEWVDLMRRT